jgi:F0F1-type ATP synthase membrane subunit c/vacuolar-type H+-ATPase subunit K
MIKNIEDLKVNEEVTAMQEATEVEVKTNIFTKGWNMVKANRKTIVTGVVMGLVGGVIGFNKGKAVGQAIAKVAENSEEIVDNVVEFVQNVEVENF